MPDVSGLLISSRLLLSASFLFCYRALNHSKHGSPSAHSIALCGGEFLCLRAFVEYYGTGIPSRFHDFGFLNFIVDISVILRYDSHKVQNFTEYWNDGFFAIFDFSDTP